MNKKIEKALNKQINAELYSAYMYFSMASYYQEKNLSGFANWMQIQVAEELMHVHKFYKYINDRGGKVTLTAIEEPPSSWKSPLDAFEAAYKHEQKVTGLINDLVNLAVAENDNATNVFLQWFVTEQVEEEANVQDVVENLKLAGDQGAGLFLIDRQLSQRKTAPTPAA